MKTTGKILLLGTNGQDNIGDDALLEVFLDNLEDITKFLYINTYDISKFEIKYGQDSSRVRIFHTIKEIYKLPIFILKVQGVVFTGGTLLRELYSNTKRGKYSSMLMIGGVVFLAWALRTNIYLSHIGMGPISTNKGRAIARIILKRVKFVTFRDSNSFNLATSLYPEISTKSKVVSDAVFTFPWEENQLERRGGLLRIGLNLDFDIANGSNWNYFLNQLESVLIALCKIHKIQIIGIPMQIGFNEHNDILTLKAFGDRLQRAGIDFEMSTPSCKEQVCAELLKLDLLLCERFHATVFSIITKTPLFALGYDIKVLALMSENGLGRYCVDINHHFDSDDMLNTLESMITNPESQRELMQIAHKKMTEKSKEGFTLLKGFLHAGKN